MAKILTYEKFREFSPGMVFAKGILPDDHTGLNMTGSGKMLKWIAVKGWAQDWCIYTHWADYDYDYVKDSGDKVLSESNIYNAVPCDEDTLNCYRF